MKIIRSRGDILECHSIESAVECMTELLKVTPVVGEVKMNDLSCRMHASIRSPAPCDRRIYLKAPQSFFNRSSDSLLGPGLSLEAFKAASVIGYDCFDTH